MTKRKESVAAGFKLPSPPARTPVVPEQAVQFVGGAAGQNSGNLAEVLGLGPAAQQPGSPASSTTPGLAAALGLVPPGQQPSSPATPTPGSPATPAVGLRKGLVDRKHGQLRRLMVYLPPELGERLEEYAFRQRRELSDVVGEALRRLLDS